MKYLAIDYGQKRTGIAVSDTGIVFVEIFRSRIL